MKEQIISKSRKKAEDFLLTVINHNNKIPISKIAGIFEPSKLKEIPIRFEAYSYIGNKYETKKENYANEIRSIWTAWKKEIEEKNYESDSIEKFFPFTVFTNWIEIEHYEPERSTEELMPLSHLECCMSILRAKEILDVPGFIDELEILKNEMKKYFSYFEIDPYSPESQWLIHRSLKLRQFNWKYIQKEAFFVFEHIKEHDLTTYKDRMLQLRELNSWLSCILHLFFSTNKKEYLTYIKAATEKILCFQKDNGSIENDIMTTCLFILVVHFLSIKNTESIKKKSLEWLISKQNNDGSWDHRNFEIFNINDWNILSTVIVLETIDILRNYTPLHSWAKKLDFSVKLEQKPIFLVADDARWDDVTMKFIDKEAVEIWVKKKSYGANNFYDLKFEDRRRTRKPIPLWNYLLIFAKYKELDPRNPELPEEIKEKDLKKIVSQLRQKLQNIFGIQENPIYYSKKDNCWKPKFNISINLNRDSSDIKMSDIEEDYYKEKEKFSDRFNTNIKSKTIEPTQGKKEE